MSNVPQAKVTPGGVTSAVPSSPRHSRPGSCVTPQRLPSPPPPSSPSCPGRQLHPAGTPELAQGHRSWHRDTRAGTGTPHPRWPQVRAGPGGFLSPWGTPPALGETTHPRGQIPSTSRAVPGWVVALCQVVASQPRCHHVPCPPGMCRFLHSLGRVRTNETGKSL